MRNKSEKGSWSAFILLLDPDPSRTFFNRHEINSKIPHVTRFLRLFVCLINLIWFKGKDKFAYGETCNSVWRDWKSCFTYPLTFPLCCECARLTYFTFLDIFCLRGRFPTLPWDFLHYYTMILHAAHHDHCGIVLDSNPGPPMPQKSGALRMGHKI